MKKYIVILLMAAGSLTAAEQKQAEGQKNFLEGINFSTLGAIRHVNITDHADVGVGLGVGLPVNKYFDIRGVVLAYENKDWGGSAVDEVGVGGKVNIVKGFQQKLNLFGTGTAYRDFENDDWGFGTGLGLQYNFTKRFNVGVGTEIRAWFDQEKDLLTTLSGNFRF